MHKIYPAIPLLGIYSWKSDAHLQRHIKSVHWNIIYNKKLEVTEKRSLTKNSESHSRAHTAGWENTGDPYAKPQETFLPNTTWKNSGKSVDRLETCFYSYLPCSPFKKSHVICHINDLRKGKNCYNCTDMPERFKKISLTVTEFVLALFRNR